MLVLEVSGLPPTLNAFMGRMHWGKRKKINEEWKALMGWELRNKVRHTSFHTPLDITVIQVSKRIPRDVDNAVIAAKFFLDAMKDGGHIPDDKPKYVSSLTLKSRKGDKDKIIIEITEYDQEC